MSKPSSPSSDTASSAKRKADDDLESELIYNSDSRMKEK